MLAEATTGCSGSSASSPAGSASTRWRRRRQSRGGTRSTSWPTVDVSLLEIVDGPDGEPVVYLLETIGQFALERLEEYEGEADATRQRHAEW